MLSEVKCRYTSQSLWLQVSRPISRDAKMQSTDQIMR